ncbi:MAG: Mth938-like domain-containing protein [Rhodospirillales bacterium]|nr:Mth938-like domain-containing protein [Rhodospirillales bacterium]
MWPDGFSEWNAGSPEDIAAESLITALADAGEIEVFLVGCGETFGPEPEGFREKLRESGYVLEWMDTGAACRTFNVLVGEDRRVAAALIAIS